MPSRAIAGRDIVWADSEPDDTSYGHKLLTDAASDAGGATRIRQVRSADEAADALPEWADLFREIERVPG